MHDSSITAVLQSVAANVRKLRLQKEKTQESLAEAADLDLRTLQRVERGTMNMRIGILLKIASALQVTPGSLFRAAKLQPPKRGRPPKKTYSQKK